MVVVVVVVVVAVAVLLVCADFEKAIVTRGQRLALWSASSVSNRSIAKVLHNSSLPWLALRRLALLCLRCAGSGFVRKFVLSKIFARSKVNWKRNLEEQRASSLCYCIPLLCQTIEMRRGFRRSLRAAAFDFSECESQYKHKHNHRRKRHKLRELNTARPASKATRYVSLPAKQQRWAAQIAACASPRAGICQCSKPAEAAAATEATQAAAQCASSTAFQ